MSATSPTISPRGISRAVTEDASSRGEEDSRSIEDNSTPRAWSGRKGKPKTRTGCKTCKIRRIKCDEGKPFCSRCVKTGRVCDGYVDPSSKKARMLPSSSSNVKLRPSPPSGLQFHLNIRFKTKPTLTILQRPLDHPDVSPQELRSLEFFHQKTTTLMSNWIVGQFWKFQLPQVCHSEPAVRHALISLSATHEAMELRCGVGPTSANVDKLERQRYACMHYNKSISQLAKVLSSRQDADSEIVAMMVGSLFVILKFMSGDFATAVLHMHNEIEIYDSWRKRHGKDLVEGSLEWNVCTIVEKQCFKSPPISDTLSRLRLQDEEFYDFDDFEVAKEALHSVFREALRLIRLHRIITWSNSDPFLDDLQIELDECHMMLSKWLAGFESLISPKYGQMTVEEEWEIETMRIMHFSIYVWLYVGIDHQSSQPNPEPFDLFDRLLSMGEDLHRRWRDSYVLKNSVTLSCETGVIPPLIFISTECSSMELRVRACRLLVNSSGTYDDSSASDDVPKNIAQLIGSTGMRKDHSEKEVIEIEIEQGTQQLDLVIRPDRNGGWEVRHESIA